MNCIQHQEQPAVAYCQNCGNALCAVCVRSVAGNIYCESCLAEKLGVGTAEKSAAPKATQAPEPLGVMPEGAANAAPPVAHTRPILAGVLGFCPGVGAMYNGQFVKAFVHVLVFCMLVGLANTYSIFGMLIAAWVFYQVFDAYQTAEARRLGLPLPDPFGFNDIGSKLGIRPTPAQPYVAPPPSRPASAPTSAAASSEPAPNAAYTAAATGQTSNTAYGAPAYVPVDPTLSGAPPRASRNEPIGALILIGLGILFLFNALGYFPVNWVSRGWPILLIALGAWLIIRRNREANALRGDGQ